MASFYTTLPIDDMWHRYFVNAAYDFQKTLGFKYRRDEIRNMVLEDDYRLYFEKNGWKIGFWAVGQWGIKSVFHSDDEADADNGKPFSCDYGVDKYVAHTICVFMSHDWYFDKFVPTDAAVVFVSSEMTLGAIIENIKRIFRNPIDSMAEYYYADYLSEGKTSFTNNKYSRYFSDWFWNKIEYPTRLWYYKTKAFLNVMLVVLIALFDKRVYHFDWQKEDNIHLIGDYYRVAIVHKNNGSDDEKRKVWEFYSNLEIADIYVAVNPLDENGKIPKYKWIDLGYLT